MGGFWIVLAHIILPGDMDGYNSMFLKFALK